MPAPPTSERSAIPRIVRSAVPSSVMDPPDLRSRSATVVAPVWTLERTVASSSSMIAVAPATVRLPNCMLSPAAVPRFVPPVLAKAALPVTWRSAPAVLLSVPPVDRSPALPAVDVPVSSMASSSEINTLPGPLKVKVPRLIRVVAPSPRRMSAPAVRFANPPTKRPWAPGSKSTIEPVVAVAVKLPGVAIA